MTLVQINWKPGRSVLRTFGWIATAMFTLVGAWVYGAHTIVGFELAPQTARVVAVCLWGLAAYCGLMAIAAPVAVWPVYVTLTAIGAPIGYVVSHLVMAVVFYGLLTPIALVMRLRGYDPLGRRLDPNATTYWRRRPPVGDAGRYFRQF